MFQLQAMLCCKFSLQLTIPKWIEWHKSLLQYEIWQHGAIEISVYYTYKVIDNGMMSKLTIISTVSFAYDNNINNTNSNN